MEPTLEIDPGLDPCPCLPALIWAEGIAQPFGDGGLPGFLAGAGGRAANLGESAWEEGVRQKVRDMLRHGRYKPSGRGKPASEFLLRAAGRGDFPTVCGPVDVNNAVSLESGLPGSIFDTGLSCERLLLRRGLPGESYVFNPSGQSIDLQDLLLVCRWTGEVWEPCGNPVKDSMATKIQPSTRRVVAVLYAPTCLPSAKVESWAQRYAELLEQHCRAASVGMRSITGTDPG